MKLFAKRLPAQKLSEAPGRDQLEDYARRKGMPLEASEKLLALALLGAYLAISWRGMENNVYTQIGIVLLIGLSTKITILVVEFAMVLREEGKTALKATKLRLRAAMMTGLPFILQVIPLLIRDGGVWRDDRGDVFESGDCADAFYYVVQSLAEKIEGGEGLREGN